MTDVQQREAARQFFYKWKGKGREDEDARSYWIDILQNIMGIDHVTDRVDFEKKVIGPDGNTKRIDVYIAETHVLIEQKSLGIPLDKPQAGHNGMTPYEQAKMYDNGLPFDEKARWIVTSNFAEIWIYDMNQRKPEPVKLELADLLVKYHMLDFLVNQATKKVTEEMQLSLQAGELVGKMYDAFLKQYRNPDDPETLKSLNKLCVRIVFCLYAEDAAVFGKKGMFHDYMAQFDAKSARKGLRDLFRVLNQTPEQRDDYLADDDPLLAAFPYVNGGLFADDDIEIPPFTDGIMELILHKASDDFDWSGISPTIFGAVFESTLNPETRRSGGMHYTSLENIHKVIDPLFLDDLKAELEGIKAITVVRTQERKLREFQDKLASLSFLDPAAGSGNFLTESYLSLRKLENETLSLLTHGQIQFGIGDITPIKVNISQFYGIEINDFAVTVARTALWIAENQMMKETEDIVHMSLDFLPLKTNANIVERNALTIDWNDVVDTTRLSYCMGNPPFVGSSYCNAVQKQEIVDIFGKIKLSNSLDYVAGWYYKAAELCQGTRIRCAFVSTNSITQGEQVAPIWKTIYDRFHIHIDFAYRTFIWDSEATDKAHVHVVIIGFSSAPSEKKKRIFEGETVIQCGNINFYLMDAPDVFIESTATNLFGQPKFIHGNKPSDGSNLILTPEEKEELLRQDPAAEPFIRPFAGGADFLRGLKRYCLWLVGIEPSELKKHPAIMKRIEGVKEMRLASTAKATREKAATPWLFFTVTQPESGNMLVGPQVSSGRRRYVPFGFCSSEVIANDMLLVMPNADLYTFGIMMSNVHNSWVRAFAGRLKSDFRYSINIVYNNFPWPAPTKEQREKIEATASMILAAREKYPNSSLADLYDPDLTPPELTKAHQANDRAVMQAYGMPIKETDEAACVAWLMRLYQQKTQA